MFGGGSIKLARVFGVRIGVEPSWFFVLFLVIYFLADSFRGEFSGGTAFALAVVSALLFFGSVLLHELGHAVVAMRNGIEITGIDLWLFGGVAKLGRDSRSAGEEFRIAVAGPVVTLVIALAAFGLPALISGPSAAFNSATLDSRRNELEAVLGVVATVNASLLVFNLIPAFPLDGGRIARAIAWKITGDGAKATRFAARTGRLLSWVMIGAGVYIWLGLGDAVSGIWLGFVGLFLGQAAKGAQQQSELTSRIDGLRVADVMDDEPVAIPAELPLDRAEEEFFLRYRYPWFPVIDAEGRYVGLVTQAGVEGLPDALRADRTVESVMAADGDAAESRLRVGTDEPLESLLSLEGLTRLGAIMAVDGDGRLRGIVTADEVRRALSPASEAAGA